MGGIALQVTLGLLIYGAFLLINLAWRKLNKTNASIITILILILPITDTILGRLYLKNQCELNTNITVNHKVSNVDGVNINYGVYADSPIFYGYKFIEGDGLHGIERAIPDADPKWANDPKYTRIEKDQYRKSKYTLENKVLYNSYWFMVERFSVRSFLDINGELGYFDWYNFKGGWAERFISAFSDAGPSGGGSCEDFNYKNKRIKIKELLNSTLIPSK